MIRPLIGGGSSECKATDENVGKRRCKHLLCACSNNSLKVIDIIQNNGGKAYLVGGCVRDMVLKEKPHDEDLTTSLTPDQITKIFEKEGYKVIPTGLQHGTVTVMIDGEGYEITTFRKDSTYSDGRHPDSVEFSTDVNDDCSRRDFTFNAMYYDGKEIIDTYNGQQDIKDKIIRTVGNPDERFNEDGLRMLRAVRFSSKLGFQVSPDVSRSIRKNKDLIHNISYERINSEITKTIQGSNRVYAFKTLQKTGLLKEVLPEIDNKDLDSKLDVLSKCPEDTQVRYASILHGTNADSICKRLKMSTADRKTIVKLSNNYEYPNFKSKQEAANFIFKNQDISDKEYGQLVTLWKASGNKDKYISEVLKQPHRISELPIKGDDIMKLGYKNKEVGKKLNEALKYSLENDVTDKKSLLKYLKSI